MRVYWGGEAPLVSQYQQVSRGSPGHPISTGAFVGVVMVLMVFKYQKQNSRRGRASTSANTNQCVSKRGEGSPDFQISASRFTGACEAFSFPKINKWVCRRSRGLPDHQTWMYDSASLEEGPSFPNINRINCC